jgi:hypothetical protein
MRTHLLILPLLVLPAAAPAMAETSVPTAETRVAPSALDRFVGTTMKGLADAPLGIVGAANTETGTVAVVGRHGEIATIHTSLMLKQGMKLKAPALGTGDIVRVSGAGRSSEPFRAGTIIVEEVDSDYW